MQSIIKAFVRHPVAPNLAMFVLIIMGLWATSQLTRQLLPPFQFNIVEVSVVWPGAAAEDVEALITQPLEDELLNLDDLRNVSSNSQNGQSRISLEYPENTDMGQALDEVKNRVSQVQNLPASSEEVQVSLRNRNELVAKVLLTGPELEQLRPLAKEFERDLRSLGIARVETIGVQREEVSIEVSTNQLNEIGYSLDQIANRIQTASQDLPAGSLGESDIARQLRSLQQKRNVEEFENLPLNVDPQGRLLRLGDVAEITRQSVSGETRVFANGRPAIELQISRADTEDALDVAERLYGWAEGVLPNLPPNVDITLYSEIWRNVDQRIDLMVSNAATGLILVLIVLYVFLNGRVAFWVAVGIPVSILTAMVALYAFGGTINVMTLFAMIMTFGIIVDDAIVVGEEAVTLYQAGGGPGSSPEKAAIKMFAPVFAASLTTVAAFLPLMLVGGATGNVLFAIPLVVICVILASLIECFVVLPGHLRHSLEGTAKQKINPWRRRFDVAFNTFKETKFKSAVEWSVANKRVTMSVAFASIIVVIGLLAGGRLGFSFFPQPEGTTISADAAFVAGSPEEEIDRFLIEAERALFEAEKSLGEEIVRLVVKKQGQSSLGTKGSHLGHLVIELSPNDGRVSTNADLIREWNRQVIRDPGLVYFLTLNTRGGIPGKDVDVQLTGANVDVLKQASLELQQLIGKFPGVSGVTDDTTYGREQLIFNLSSAGQSLGLTSQELGSQLRSAYEGKLVQTFQDQGDEIEVRLRLAKEERDSLNSLETFPVIVSDNEVAYLSNIANLDYRQGFDSLKHSSGQLALRVSADVDPTVNNANAIRGQLASEILPVLDQKYGVVSSLRGQAENQSESVGDLALAVPIAFILIYIILAWIFGSYLWPLAVLSIVPFGLVGGIFGHWLLNFDITMLSLFGFFGLTGIVINDSIILVDVFKKLRDKGMKVKEAAIEAGCRRFRAVLLTSITTVAGTMPLLLETSLEAQFLKPMIISISFGLIFGTFLVLFLLPTVLVTLEILRERFARLKSAFFEYLTEQTGEMGLMASASKALDRQELTDRASKLQSEEPYEGRS